MAEHPDGKRFLRDGANVAEIVVTIGGRAYLRLPSLRHDWIGGDWTRGAAFVTLRPDAVVSWWADPQAILGDGPMTEEARANGTRWAPAYITWPGGADAFCVREGVFVEALAVALEKNR